MLCIQKSNSLLGDFMLDDTSDNDNLLLGNDDDHHEKSSDNNDNLLDESKRLHAEVTEELEEARRRQKRNHQRRKKRELSADRNRKLEERLAANEAVKMGRELLAKHSDQTSNDEHRSLIDGVRKQEIEFFDLSSFANKPISKPTHREVERLEDRITKHKAKNAQQQAAYDKFERDMKKRDDEIANKEAKDSQAKAAFAALKAKKAKQRKARSKSPKRSPKVVPTIRRQLSTSAI